jgi:HPt (histidine-containing phosphotransfer) domain-containing protein
MRGDVALYRKILCMFRDRERDFKSRFHAALDEGSSAAARHAHDLKGEAGTLGAYEVQLAAEALERACVQGVQTEEVKALAEKVTGLLDPVIAGLQVLGPAPPT